MSDYISYQDHARLEYGRILWKVPAVRERLLRHWMDPRHPYSHRFLETYAPLVREVLESTAERKSDEVLDGDLRKRGYSLRVVMREIPPVFGSFY